MKKTLLLIFALTLLTPLIVYAQDTIISIDIEGTNSYINYAINLDSNTEQFILNIPRDSAIIYVKDNFGDINYENKNNILRMNLEKIDTKRLILIKLKTKNLIAQKEDYNEIIFENKEESELIINLPENAIINSIETNKGGLIKNSEGTLFVEWNNLKKEDIIILRYKIQDYNYLYGIYGAILLVIILLIILLVIRNKKKMNEKEMNEKENNQSELKTTTVQTNMALNIDAINLLNEKEKSVVEYVIKNEGCLQSNLQKEVGYNKSNLTKIIKKLEFRAILKRKKIGKINRLYLGVKINKENNNNNNNNKYR